MKKFIYSVAMMLMVGTMFSCQKDDTTKGGIDETLTGSMVVNFTFPETKTTVAQLKLPLLKPWVVGDKVLLLRLDGAATTPSTGTTLIKAAYAITVTAAGTNTVSGVEVGTARWMAIRDYASEAAPSAITGTVDGQRALNGVNPLELTGKTLAEVQFSLVSHTQPGRTADFYFSPKDIFVGESAGSEITLGGTGTVSIQMHRAVSLIRTKLIVSADDHETHQNTMKLAWDSPNNFVAVRRASEKIDLAGKMTQFTDGKKGVLHHGTFLTADPLTGYSNGNGTAIIGNAGTAYDRDFSAWQDFIVFPSKKGEVENVELFNIVIAMEAKEGYVGINAAGVAVTVTAGQLVYFFGQVDKRIEANSVLQIAAEINKNGYIDLPGPADFGNLDVTVHLNDWETVVDVTVPM